MTDETSSGVRPGLLAVVDADTTVSDVRLVGELDLATRSVLTGLVADQLTSRHREVRLDVSQLAFCDVAGLRTVLECSRTLSQAGGRLALVNPPPPLLRLAELTGWADELGLGTSAGPTGTG